MTAEDTTRDSTRQGLIGYGEAMDRLRADPKFADLIRDIYLGPDPLVEARRFEQSAEWQETRRLLGGRLEGARVVDLGAGAGIASYAFIQAGAREVLAVEPWTGAAVGRDAINRLGIASIVTVDARGEAMPIESASVDIVYARQTLHHADDLRQMLVEIARLLRPGGAMFTCRDHVADDDEQLAAFLAGHPVHQLAGGEHAYSLDAYLGAIRSAGLRVEAVLGPWDSVINAFPHVRSVRAFRGEPRRRLVRRWGLAGRIMARIPGVTKLMRWRMTRARPPGRPYTFVAIKDA
jgi:ubiquinone/menaquinone biosynthesis C-methylase UbiE